MVENQRIRHFNNQRCQISNHQADRFQYNWAVSHYCEIQVIAPDVGAERTTHIKATVDEIRTCRMFWDLAFHHVVYHFNSI